MKKSKLIQILKAFSPKEMIEFEKFISSSFFGCKNFVVNFFKELKKYYPEFRDEDIDKEKIYSVLYRGKAYNDGLVRRMSSDLIHMAEEYLMYNEFKENRAYRDHCLLGGLRKKNLNDIFEIKSVKILKDLENENIDSLVFFNKYVVELETYNYKLINKSKDLMKFGEAYMVSMIIIFLETMYSFIGYSESFKHEYKINSEIIRNFLKHFNYEEFIKSIETDKSKFSNYLSILYFTFCINKNKDDEESYKKLKELLQKGKNVLTDSKKLNGFAILSNFFVHHNLKSNSKYIEDAFEVYDIILKEKLFLAQSDFLQISFCRLIISTARKCNKFDYISDFVNSYSQYFNEDYKDSLINYCNALVEFSKKLFGEALEHAALVNLERPAFKADIKILKTKSYYELNYFDSFYSEIDTFKHFLSSDVSLKKDSITNGKNYIKYISKLAKIKENNSPDKLFILKKEVENENNVNEKPWLLEKINELRGFSITN